VFALYIVLLISPRSASALSPITWRSRLLNWSSLPNGPHYASWLSVRPSVCLLWARNPKTKRRQKTRANVIPHGKSNNGVLIFGSQGKTSNGRSKIMLASGRHSFLEFGLCFHLPLIQKTVTNISITLDPAKYRRSFCDVLQSFTETKLLCCQCWWIKDCHNLKLKPYRMLQYIYLLLLLRLLFSVVYQVLCTIFIK